jgi:hypothetical protein
MYEKEFNSMDLILLVIGVIIFGMVGAINLTYTFISDSISALNQYIKTTYKNTLAILQRDNSANNTRDKINANQIIGAMLVAVLLVSLTIKKVEVDHETEWLSIFPSVIGSPLSPLEVVNK